MHLLINVGCDVVEHRWKVGWVILCAWWQAEWECHPGAKIKKKRVLVSKDQYRSARKTNGEGTGEIPFREAAAFKEEWNASYQEEEE